MSKKNRFVVANLSAVLSVGSVGLLPGIATAQSMLEEVIVTARKREETLQETPVAVTAFTGENLEDLGMRDIADLTKVVPNVDMYTGNGTNGAGNVFIRGIGARNTGVNYDSGVGIYIDGVYVSRADGGVMDNVDVQSVQVLRGPQGTLFGKNTTGGAILYNTKRPTDEFEGNVEVRGGNYNQLDGKLTVNVPLIEDTLLSRFSAYATTRDGYVTARAGGPEQKPGNVGMQDREDYSDVNRYGGQAQLRWLASDFLTLDLNYHYAKTDQKARGQNCQVTDVEGAGWQADLQNDFIVIPSTGQSIADWCQENNDLGKDDIMANLDPNKYEATNHTFALTADWDITDEINLKSITSARLTEGAEVNELDAIGIPLLDRSNYGWDGAKPRDTNAYSQELQIAGTAFNDKLDYVVGVFGFHENTDKGTQVSPSGPFFGAVFDDNQAFYINQTTALEAKNTSASAFSQVDWNFDDYWRLTLGVRYTWEERELVRRFRVPDLADVATTGDAMLSVLGEQFIIFPKGPDTFNPNHGFVTPSDPNNPSASDPLADQRMKTDDTDITPMFSLQRNFDPIGFMDSGTAYVTVAKGYLSGGISDTIGVDDRQIYEYKPEEVWNYEIGFKMQAWDNRLRFNTALFYTDYKDRQLTTVTINPDTGRIAGALINAKKSRIAGLELESVIIPIDNLQITANATFNDGKINEYDDTRITPAEGATPASGCTRTDLQLSEVDACPIDRSDEDLPRLPDQIYFLAVQYNWESEYGTVTPMVSYSYRKNLNNSFDRSSYLSGVYKDSQEEVSARVTWLSPEQDWRITAYGNNLTDDRYVLGGTPLLDTTNTAATIYNLPRTYGVELAYQW